MYDEPESWIEFDDDDCNPVGYVNTNSYGSNFTSYPSSNYPTCHELDEHGNPIN